MLEKSQALWTYNGQDRHYYYTSSKINFKLFGFLNINFYNYAEQFSFPAILVFSAASTSIFGHLSCCLHVLYFLSQYFSRTLAKKTPDTTVNCRKQAGFNQELQRVFTEQRVVKQQLTEAKN